MQLMCRTRLEEEPAYGLASPMKSANLSLPAGLNILAQTWTESVKDEVFAFAEDMVVVMTVERVRNYRASMTSTVPRMAIPCEMNWRPGGIYIALPQSAKLPEVGLICFQEAIRKLTAVCRESQCPLKLRAEAGDLDDSKR